jgi:type II restriction enzyme
VGSLFSYSVYYLLVKAQEFGKLPSELNFSLSKQHPLVKRYTAIRVGDEILKPDMDLLVFSEREGAPLTIFSLKTSPRERGGQTHRWKLVLDIALHCEELKERYALNYKVERDVRLGFITANFYKELGSPQQRAALRFFDYVYLAREDVEVSPPIKRLSSIVSDLRELYGR